MKTQTQHAKRQEIVDKLVEHYSRENLGILNTIAENLYVTGKGALLHVFWDDQEQTIKMKVVDDLPEGSARPLAEGK